MSKLTAAQAHATADQFHANQFPRFIADLHASVKADAQRGLYTKTVAIPSIYQGRALELLSYFNLFNYQVSVQGTRVTLKW